MSKNFKPNTQEIVSFLCKYNSLNSFPNLVVHISANNKNPMSNASCDWLKYKNIINYYVQDIWILMNFHAILQLGSYTHIQIFMMFMMMMEDGWGPPL